MLMPLGVALSHQISTLGAIASLAEKLEVPPRVAATHRERNDVVVLQLLVCTTSHAATTVAFPHKDLHIVGDRRTGRRAIDVTVLVKCGSGRYGASYFSISLSSPPMRVD